MKARDKNYRDQIMSKILLVENNLPTAMLLKIALEGSFHIVDWCRDGKIGLEYLLSNTYDLAILDYALPKVDGIEICRTYKKRRSYGETLILFFTEKTELEEKITAFDSGADDYLTRPISKPELFTRINALLRRSHANNSKVLKLERIELNLFDKSVQIDGTYTKFSPTEISLLELFIRHPARIFTHEQLIAHSQSTERNTSISALRQRISRLRKCLENHCTKYNIVNVKGIGYKFDSQPNS